MKLFIATILHFLLLFPSHLPAQDLNEELLSWNAKRKLKWSDYKAAPDPDSDAAASTTTYLRVEYKISDNNFGYTIKSWFSKTRSWGLHKSDYILSHEQGHFDIAEIFARKLNSKLKSYQFNQRSYQKDLGKIYDNILEEKSAMQNNYDRETRHSINKEKQAEWLKKIEELLKEYELFADY